jgi:hypothetical protein
MMSSNIETTASRGIFSVISGCSKTYLSNSKIKSGQEVSRSARIRKDKAKPLTT